MQKGLRSVGIVFMIVAGAVTGWLAAFMLRIGRLSHAAKWMISAGIAGALFAGLVVSPLIGTGDLVNGSYRVSALLVSVFGSIAAIMLIRLSQTIQSR